MNSATLRNLAIVVAVLLAVLVGLRLADDSSEATTGQRLFATLKDQINDIDSLLIDGPGERRSVITRLDNAWVVETRGNFPANVDKVRSVLLALADARVLEQKTSNPDRYAALGVQDPEAANAAGMRLTATGGDKVFGVVIGNAASASNRYVRRVDESVSLLIDRDPDIPAESAGWLASELLDIDTDAVSSVLIEHADGERIYVEKASAEEVDFTVADIPAGRELRYPTVANGIAGALNGLELEDLRAASGSEPVAETLFTTFDNRQIRATVHRDADESLWISLRAFAGNDGESVADINARTEGREFRVAEFRTSQLMRRWNDILNEQPDDE